MVSAKTMKDKFMKNIMKDFFGKSIFSKIMMMVLFFSIVFLTTISALSPEKYEFEIGQKSPVDLRAPRDLEDTIATERAMRRAIELVEPREKINPTIQIDVKKRIERFFNNAYDIRGQQELIDEDKLELLKQNNDLNLSENELVLILDSSHKDVKNIESYIYEIVTQVMSTGIKKEELEKERNNITSYFISIQEFSEDLRNLGITTVNSSIQPNRFLDVETTQQKIEEAKKNVEKVIIKKGSLIINAGETITKDKLQLLKDAGLAKEDKKNDLFLHLGIGLMIAVAEAIFLAYMYVFNREILQKPAKLYLIFIVLVSIFFISKSLYNISPNLVPMAALTMVIAILIDARLAIVANLMMTLLIALTTGNNVEFLIISLIGGTVGAFSVTHTHQRTSIFFSGLAVSVSNAILIISFGLMNNIEISKIFMDSFFGILNGVFCAILTIGSLPLWESTFGILTPFKLLELSNPNHPVLKKLLLEAPGTYHHSIIVGNLSEAAADVVGANGLFTRVSSYYHDIGKLKRPYFFKENQLSHENPHEKITAGLSTLIITSHVKDGIEIARKHKLPEEIVDVILEHHGTTLVKYFYHKALNDETTEDVQENNYRYDGVKPQSRESAIVMLADSVEAAVRSITDHTGEKIKGLIDKIITDKINDKQLDECNLTLKDLEKIADSFKTVLMGIYHERIEYPELNHKTAEVEA